ncbi:MAG TPA: 3D domain-containing protein [Terriglobales bacterium]|nr:3D domain-containing protein [Terriglobales bacterium]
MVGKRPVGYLFKNTSTWLLAIGVWTMFLFFPSAGLPEEFDIPPPTSLEGLHLLQIWATEYHVVLIVGAHGDIPLLDTSGNPLGPQLTPKQFCNAALEGTVKIDNCTFNQDGKGSARQVNCIPYVHRDVGFNRFAKAKGPFGDGVRGYALIPYRTIATDNRFIPTGTVLFIPSAVGQLLPTGQKHDGYFFAGDVGDMKDNHIDVFNGDTAASFKFVLSVPNPTVPSYVIDKQAIVNRLSISHSLSNQHERESHEWFLCQPKNGRW